MSGVPRVVFGGNGKVSRTGRVWRNLDSDFQNSRPRGVGPCPSTTSPTVLFGTVEAEKSTSTTPFTIHGSLPSLVIVIARTPCGPNRGGTVDVPCLNSSKGSRDGSLS